MRKLILFLSCFMLVTTWTGMALAVEVGPCPEMSQAAHVPVYCDGDQVPADCEKNCPRNLSCHGHHVGTAIANPVSASTSTKPDLFGMRSGGALADRDLDQALRPPQA